MLNTVVAKIRSILNRLGIDVVRYQKHKISYAPDFSDSNIRICEAVKDYTMTTPERVNSLIEATEYIVKNNIDGAIVECGVWKGGSIMAVMMTLKQLSVEDRDLYLYDTFAGMNAPTDRDISFQGEKAVDRFNETKFSNDSSEWCLSSLEEVTQNVLSTGYPLEKIHFIQGKVEDTIPAKMPGKIALLRLDTDWYESTKHELHHLFPLLQQNGVLIIDDYGFWKGSRKAVDEYISDKNICILLNRIDESRIAIKTQV
jgi:O-methyltransferase